MALFVYRSNRTERLAERLAEVVTEPVAGAAEPECIVVQGQGMERWLSMRLAERFGVWANPDFPFPRKIIRRAADAVLGEEETRGEVFEPHTLTWAIAHLLPGFLDHPGFEALGRYLAGDARGVRRFELAARVAETFDQYVVYRPETVLGWERGDDDHWQAVVWRELVKQYGSDHVAARIARLVAALRAGAGAIERFPRRVSLFGISALPPLYVGALAALARRIDVHFFVLSPSASYWAEIRSQREIIRRLRRDERDLAEEELHLEVGNPLLASLGRVGGDFQKILEGAGDYDDRDRYDDPGTATMLGTLQSDMLALHHRREGGDAAPLVLGDDDASIAVHSCHGPMREVEVLHDQLLDLFAKAPGLEPRDVVVMSPAIDAYAPYIDAVFRRAAGPGRPQIPYHVADRTVRATDEVVDAFERLLEVLRGRMGAAEVLDLLAIEPVRERFGIEAEDLDVLREWTRQSGIRWGVDRAHRLAERGTDVHENTWSFGLERLLLGHAMRGDGRDLFAGVLPFDGVEGGGDLLGRFVDFCETLFDLRGGLEAPRPIAAWRDDLGRLLGRAVATTRLNRDQHRGVRKGLEALAARAKRAGFDEAVPLEVVRCLLDLDFRQSVPTGVFLSRGVTFCALVPMRSIPFRVVCLLGMSDGAFPRMRRPFGFDLMASARRRAGDRSQRDDDRYLFLEAILSARDRMIVTYVGHSIHDNRESPPSVVVSELLDVLDESFHVSGGGKARDRVVVHHPLQPFSRRYFAKAGDPRLFSYESTYHTGAEQLGQARVERAPFLRRPLVPEAAAERVVTIDELVRFLENPVRGFLRRRLGFWLEDDLGEVDFRDPLDPNDLERWKLGMSLLERGLAGEDLAKALPSLRATGCIPQGVPGEVFFDDLRENVEALAGRVRDLLGGDRLDPIEVDERVDDATRLVGVLRDVWPAAQVMYTCSKLSAKHEIGPWVRHLVLCLRREGGLPRVTRLVAQKKDDPTTVAYHDVADAKEILRRLLDLYWLGQQVPLPFFPRSAWAYLDALKLGKEAAALRAARNEFEGNRYEGGEGERGDLYVRLVFGGLDPLAPEFRPVAEGGEKLPSFTDLAEAVFGPMVEFRTSE